MSLTTPAPSPASDSPLRVIQVGAGGMGHAWLDTLAASGDVELVGLVDLDLAVARRAAEQTGWGDVPLAQSVDELAASTGAEAVINVTVPRAHHLVNVAALRLGLPVLCEKPLSESVAECLSMVAASEVTQTLLMVSQSRRYWRHLAAYRRQLAELGPIGVLTCEFFKAPHFGGFRDAMDQPLLIDMAIHQFDLARYLLDADPVSVSCESHNPAWSWYAGDAAAEAVFTFADGVRFSFSGSWCSPGLETSWNGAWRASTAEGSALWDGDNNPTAARGEEDLLADVRDEPEAIAGSLAEFVHAVRTGVTPSGEVHRNVHSVVMVESAIRSATTRQRVLTADVLDEAWAEALQEERSDDVRAVLSGWSSVQDALGAPRYRVNHEPE